MNSIQGLTPSAYGFILVSLFIFLKGYFESETNNIIILPLPNYISFLNSLHKTEFMKSTLRRLMKPDKLAKFIIYLRSGRKISQYGRLGVLIDYGG